MFLPVIVLLLLIPLQANAYLTNFTMTSFQSLGQEYVSGEIYYTLNNTSSYSFCVDNYTEIAQGVHYWGILASIGGNDGLLKSAYLMDKYAPGKPGRSIVPGLTDITRQGVALQWAIWMILSQDSVLTNLYPLYPDIYTASGLLKSEAESASNISRYAGMYKEVLLWNDSSMTVKKQDLLTPVPAPPSVFVFGSGLLGLWLSKQGIRKKLC